MVVCRNVVPHIENIKEVMKGLNHLISNNGIGAIEFHDASNILSKNHYDYIYHEHIFYFTLNCYTGVRGNLCMVSHRTGKSRTAAQNIKMLNITAL